MKRAFVTGGSGFVGQNLIRNLCEKGVRVRALARSEQAIQAVKSAGAEPIRGDLSNTTALKQGMEQCDTVFHLAAYNKDWGDPEMYHDVHVLGTARVLSSARHTGVKRFVHMSTEAILAGGEPIQNADETRPIPDKPVGQYSLTKGLAERAVLAANDNNGMVTVSVRPGLIWGRGDTSFLKPMLEAIKSGSFRWINGGRFPTSTCHVANVCEGTILAAEHGKGGEAYFLTDGPPVEFRSFVTAMLATQGVDSPTKELPLWLAKPLANLYEFLWNLFGWHSPPPVTQARVNLFGQEVTINDSKARKELGYQSRVKREHGLKEMKGEPQRTAEKLPPSPPTSFLESET